MQENQLQLPSPASGCADKLYVISKVRITLPYARRSSRISETVQPRERR